MDELIPVWNGAMEHDRTAPGLSNYIGASSIYHSPSWAQQEDRAAALEAAAAGKSRSRQKPWALRQPGPSSLPQAQQDAIAALLRKGVGYRAIVDQLGSTIHHVRNIGKLIGLERARGRRAA